MYKLTALQHKAVQQCLQNASALRKAIATFGSPLNILFPEVMKENIAAFNEVINTHNIDGKIHYAYKPNKSALFAQQALLHNCRIDVASTQELLSALDVGFVGVHIEATGPKSLTFIEQCIANGVTINVDALFELEQIIRVAADAKQPISVLLRLSNFPASSVQTVSSIDRFGIEYSALDIALSLLKECVNIHLTGFSFHINTNSLTERTIAIENVLKAIFKAQEQGFTQCSVIDIGGGFQANFVEHKEEWDEFLTQVKQYAKGATERLSLNGSKFGYSFDGSAVSGSYVFQDFWNPKPKQQFLDAILSHTLNDFENRTVSQVVADGLLTLWIEPGQGLLDQCGITVAQVLGVKEVRGENVIFLDMNYTHLDADRYELFTDPIHLSFEERPDDKTKGYFLSGNLCLSIDVIMNHKVFLDTKPKSGDLLAFINTAAYRMDFVESQPLQHPIAQKVAWSNQRFLPEKDYLSLIHT